MRRGVDTQQVPASTGVATLRHNTAEVKNDSDPSPACDITGEWFRFFFSFSFRISVSDWLPSCQC